MNSLFKFVQTTYMLITLGFVVSPSFSEASTISPIEGSFEIVSSLSVEKTLFDYAFLNTSRIGVEFYFMDKFGKDFTEFGTGICESGLPFSGYSQLVRNNPGQAGPYKTQDIQFASAKNDSEYFHTVLFNIFTWIILPLLYGCAPNVELSRPLERSGSGSA